MKMLTAKTGIPLLCCGPLDLPAQTLNGSMPGARFWYCPQGYYGNGTGGDPGESCPLQQRPVGGGGHSAFTINPLSTYLYSPLILVCSGLLATIWGTADAGHVKLCQSIKE